MELKPNFDVLEFLSHQPRFTQHYNMKAAELSAETAKSVIRYADDPVMAGQYNNSVHTHVNQVAYDSLRIMNIMRGDDYSHIAYKPVDEFYTQVLTSIIFHDDGEKPFGEWQTANGETDPKIKEALKNYNIAAMEARTGLMNIRVSLLAAHEGNPRIYTDFVAQCRDALDVKKQYEGGSPTPEQILAFNQKAIQVLDQKEIELAKNRKWNDGALLNQLEFGKQYYLDIEETRTVAGTFGKLAEKVEGTTYQNRVATIKKNTGGRLISHLVGNSRLRMAARYEGHLDTMWSAARSAGGEWVHMAAGITAACYAASRDQFAMSKRYLTLNPREDEPTPHAPDADHAFFHSIIEKEKKAGATSVHDTKELLALYNGTLHDMMDDHAGIPVPKKGKALFDTDPQPSTQFVYDLPRGALDRILRVF